MTRIEKTNTTPNREQVVQYIEALEDKDLRTRRQARQALTECGAGCLDIMLDELLDGSFQIRWEVAKALGEMKEPASARALIRALEDEEQDVRWLAAVALANLGLPALTPLLEILLEKADNVYLRQGVHHVLSISDLTRHHEDLSIVHDALGPMEDTASLVPVVQTALAGLKK